MNSEKFIAFVRYMAETGVFRDPEGFLKSVQSYNGHIPPKLLKETRETVYRSTVNGLLQVADDLAEHNIGSGADYYLAKARRPAAKIGFDIADREVQIRAKII